MNSTIQRLADELYRVGYTDGRYENDYDPRHTEEWQRLVDAIQQYALELANEQLWESGALGRSLEHAELAPDDEP